jgi:hypothetical protein
MWSREEILKSWYFTTIESVFMLLGGGRALAIGILRPRGPECLLTPR